MTPAARFPAAGHGGGCGGAPPPGGLEFPILPTAAWFGLVAGLLELAALTVRVQLLEKGFFLRSGHFVWMVPVSVLAIFASCGLLLALAARVGRRPSSRLVIGGFLFLALMGQLLLIPGLHAGTSGLLSAGIALRVGRRLDRRRAALRRAVRLSSPLLAAAVLLLAAVAIARDPNLQRRASKPAVDGAPNVLLIVLDTVRADRLGAYGYGRDTTPNLARLAAQGVLFRRARSTAPWTLPSHASLFTGRWPHELRAEQLGRLDARHPTLAEVLGARGYATGGFVANTFFCGAESGLARGFDAYRDHPVNPGAILRSSSVGWFLARNLARARERLLWATTANGPEQIALDFPRKSGAVVHREFLDWLDANPGRPFFAFLNDFDAHDPYIPPERPPRPFGAAPRTREQFAMLRDWQKLDRTALGPASQSLARDAYDDCIAALDRELGNLLDELRRRDILDRTLLILTADHGEQFGEHNAFGHGMSLYEPEVHVPLIVAFPGKVPRGVVVEEPVSLRDLPATIVALLGGARPAPFPGTPLTTTWDGTPPDPNAPRAALSELESPIDSPGSRHHHGPCRSLLAGRTSYLRHGDGTEELFDLDADPAESHDLARSAVAAPTLAHCRELLGRLAPVERRDCHHR